jgi:hypothetical protein
LVLAKSPSLLPSPVKSKRKTAMPLAARARLMREAAAISLPQVKQCANSAKLMISPTRSGNSSNPARVSPSEFSNSSLIFFIRYTPKGYHLVTGRATTGSL